MKIAFYEIKTEERLFFETRLSGHELFFFESTISEALQSPQSYDAVSVFVHSRITDEVLEKLPKLCYLQTRSTGYDHVRCQALYARKVVVSNVAGYGGPAVAEFAFSLLLNATRHTHTALERAKKGDFHYADLKGIELYGKTLGILGLGTIGSQMARIAKGFGMHLAAWSRTRKPIVDELGINYCELETVLSQSDIIMIALPLTPSTRALINEKRAKNMKSDAIVVNIARGEIIEDSIYSTRKNIFYLDVIGDAKCVQYDNIFYTPHMAYYTIEALQRINEISLENLQAFIEGRPLPNCLKLPCQRDYA